MCLALHFPGRPSDFLTVSALQYKSPRVDTSNRHWQQFVERSRDKPYLAHPPRQLLHISFLLVLVSSNSVRRLALKKGSHVASRINGWFWILCTQTARQFRLATFRVERLLSETKASLEWKEFRGLLKKLFAGVEHRKRRAEGNWKTFEFFENLALRPCESTPSWDIITAKLWPCFAFSRISLLYSLAVVTLASLPQLISQTTVKLSYHGQKGKSIKWHISNSARVLAN